MLVIPECKGGSYNATMAHAREGLQHMVEWGYLYVYTCGERVGRSMGEREGVVQEGRS